MLQPGSDIISKHGGIHNFMNWQGPILTDSGGFQIFSLGHGSVADEIKRKNSNQKKSLLNISEEGALFKSFIDGRSHLLTPEKSIAIQRDIGADLILVFDECTPFHVDKSYTDLSMKRSHNWSFRSINSFLKSNKYLPTKDDNLFIESLMTPVSEPGVYADWIAAPDLGIDNKPGDFEYVKIHDA